MAIMIKATGVANHARWQLAVGAVVRHQSFAYRFHLEPRGTAVVLSTATCEASGRSDLGTWQLKCQQRKVGDFWQ